MNKMLWMGVMVMAALVAPAMATLTVGETAQCWSFDQEPIGGNFVYADQDTLENPFGTPLGMINDLSGQGFGWGNGAIFGPEFKIILDIPNQPIPNPYKELTLEMRYQGDITFSWVADVETGALFTPVRFDVEDEGNGWKTVTKVFRFEPNPREELVVIGLKGTQEVTGQPVDAVLDWICVETVCVPEPATLVLLAMGGAVCVMGRKKA